MKNLVSNVNQLDQPFGSFILGSWPIMDWTSAQVMTTIEGFGLDPKVQSGLPIKLVSSQLLYWFDLGL